MGRLLRRPAAQDQFRSPPRVGTGSWSPPAPEPTLGNTGPHRLESRSRTQPRLLPTGSRPPPPPSGALRSSAWPLTSHRLRPFPPPRPSAAPRLTHRPAPDLLPARCPRPSLHLAPPLTAHPCSWRWEGRQPRPRVPSAPGTGKNRVRSAAGVIGPLLARGGPWVTAGGWHFRSGGGRQERALHPTPGRCPMSFELLK